MEESRILFPSSTEAPIDLPCCYNVTDDSALIMMPCAPNATLRNITPNKQGGIIDTCSKSGAITTTTSQYIFLIRGFLTLLLPLILGRLKMLGTVWMYIPMYE